MRQQYLEAKLLAAGLTACNYFEQIGSTNDAAKQWLADGGQGTYAAIANEQLQGRGREERHWQTAPNSAIALSLAFSKWTLDSNLVPLLAGVVGIAVSSTISKQLGLELALKWPNDLLVEGKKVGGILIENAWRGDGNLECVMGIGINVASSSIVESSTFRFPAGYLEQFGSSQIDREELTVAIVKKLLNLVKDADPVEILREWNALLAYRNESVEFAPRDGVITQGKLAGIDGQGRLILELGSGQTERFIAGEIQLKPR